MQRLWIPTVIVLLAAGCGSSSSPSTTTTPPPTSPAPTPVAGTTTLTMQLGAANEIPAIVNAESTVTGTATITLHTTKDGSGNVTAATADFQVSSAGFPAGSELTMAHIHQGAAGVGNGAIVVDTGLSSGSVTIANGAGSFQRTGINVPPDIAQGIVTTPGNYYFNIHTALNPNGVARGQLDNSGGGASTPPPVSPSPSPYSTSKR